MAVTKLNLFSPYKICGIYQINLGVGSLALYCRVVCSVWDGVTPGPSHLPPSLPLPPRHQAGLLTPVEGILVAPRAYAVDTSPEQSGLSTDQHRVVYDLLHQLLDGR